MKTYKIFHWYYLCGGEPDCIYKTRFRFLAELRFLYYRKCLKYPVDFRTYKGEC